MKGRKIGTIATLGVSTAAIAMLTGLATARADDLQANQQLLEQRIDQLAAVGLQPGQGAVFSIDHNAAAGAAVTAGSFPRSILIPGTDTSVKIYGQITEIVDYYITGATPNQSPQNTTVGDNGEAQGIPLRTSGVASARENGMFFQSPRESKIGVETRTPTPFGEARTVFEFDWSGSTTFAPGGGDPTSVSDNLLPRLRYAYGTLGGFLAGQATSNFSDPDANGETLDFGGNFGEPGHVRIPQVRYTMPAWWGGSFSVSAETPETDIGNGAAGIEGSDAGVIPTATTTTTTTCPATAAPGATTVTCTSTSSTSVLTSGQLPTNIAASPAPDLTAAFYMPEPWGHIDLSAVVRPDLEVSDGKYFSKQYVGYGGHLGFDFKPGWLGWAKDDVIFHAVAGSALGSFLNSSSNFALETNYGAPAGSGAIGTTATTAAYGAFGGPTSAVSASEIVVKPTTEFGGEIGYQHWWTDDLRSNINAGWNHHDMDQNIVGATSAASFNKNLLNSHANLIWNPVSFIDIGVEYTWAYRQVLNGSNATMNALISKFAFRF